MKKNPNILLLVSDHHRGDWMPYPDYIFESFNMENPKIHMPNIENLMKEGVTFTNCITPSPLCAPARACLASGLSYENCGVIDNGQDYPVDQKTFYSVLKEAGYSVGGVGKFDLHKPTYWWGLDGWVDNLGKIGFTNAIDNEGKIDGYLSGKDTPKGPYLKYLHDNGLVDIYIKDFKRRLQNMQDTKPTKLPKEAYCDNWIANNAVNMIKDFPKNSPWFLQVNYAGPHPPWDITKRMKDKWKDVNLPQPVANDKMNSRKLNEIRQNFAAMIENIDLNTGLILKEIKSRFGLDNTIVIYTSDHGDMLGDLNLFDKCQPYRGSISIPLVVWGRGVKKEVVTDFPAELQDLASTIVDFCGCNMPEAENSISLKPLLTGNSNQKKRDYHISSLNNWFMISNKKYKAVFDKGELNEFYNLEKDNWEIDNIKGKNPNIEKEFISLYKGIRGV